MGFFSKNKKEEIVALFDIGSGSVGGSIILSRLNKKPIVLSMIRREFPLRDKVDSKFLLKEMLSSLEHVSKEIQNQSKSIPEKVYVLLSSPWAETSLKYIRKKHKKDFTFTEKEAQNLILEESRKFKKNHSSFDKIIDRRVTNILLNGYNIPHPNGKRARELEMQLFLCISSSQLISKIESVVERVYHNKIICTSQMFSDSVVVRDMFEDLNSFIILDIDEEVTEVSVMRNDLLVGVASFPYGRNGFIRNIAQKLNKSIEEIQSFLSIHKDGHLHKDYSNDIENAIRFANKEWIYSLKKVFRVIFSELLIPHHIFLIVDKKSEHWFKNLLNKEEFSEFTTTNDSFSVIIGNTKLLHGLCDFSVNIVPDSNLTIQSIFINKINFK